jgi:hypothetical protein
MRIPTGFAPTGHGVVVLRADADEHGREEDEVQERDDNSERGHCVYCAAAATVRAAGEKDSCR